MIPNDDWQREREMSRKHVGDPNGEASHLPRGSSPPIVNLSNKRASATVKVASFWCRFHLRINHITLRRTCCALAFFATFLAAAHSDAIYINCSFARKPAKNEKRDEHLESRMRSGKSWCKSKSSSRSMCKQLNWCTPKAELSRELWNVSRGGAVYRLFAIRIYELDIVCTQCSPFEKLIRKQFTATTNISFVDIVFPPHPTRVVSRWDWREYLQRDLQL